MKTLMQKIESAINTKAISVVHHLAKQKDEIMEIASKYNLQVVEIVREPWKQVEGANCW